MRIVDIEYIFKLLKNKMESKNISNKDDIFNNIKEILFYQYLLLKSLSFNINDNIEIYHYTSLNTLLLLNDKKEDEGKIRIVNISNANDPKEGKTLESIFNKNGLDIKLKNNENKEAMGICLVIDKEYFNNNTYQFSPSIQITNNILEDNKNLYNDKDEEQVDNTKKFILDTLL